MVQQKSIKAEKVRVVKAKKVLLDGLDFTIRSGAVTGLIGPSGSGKTTLMRSIIGVQKLSGGRLTVLGLKAGSRQLRSKIGYASQSPAVYSDLTVLQNLRYFAVLANASRAQVGEILERVQLTPHKNQSVENLSGGQQARVSLAVALLGDPDLLIMDEPTVGLDPFFVRNSGYYSQRLPRRAKHSWCRAMLWTRRSDVKICFCFGMDNCFGMIREKSC